MRNLLSHQRFWLFAPFIGLLALGGVSFGLWHLAVGRLSDEMAANGVSWQSIERHGYPARIALDLHAPRWRDDRRLWQNSGLSITMMPFQGGHAIVDFHGAHDIETRIGTLHLAHQGNLASLVADLGGLVRASFEIDKPRVTTRLKDAAAGHLFTAEKIGLHGRRGDTQDQYKIALVTKHLRLPEALGRAADKPITRLDILSVLPTPLLRDGPAAGQKLVLERLTMERGGLTLIARGTVRLAADGFVQGRLDLDAVKLEKLADLLQEFALISARERDKWLFLGGLGSALGGNTQDRLSVPLQFKAGRTSLGPLDLGPAPRWR